MVPSASEESARLGERTNGLLPFSAPEICFSLGFQDVSPYFWIGTAFITFERAGGELFCLGNISHVGEGTRHVAQNRAPCFLFSRGECQGESIVAQRGPVAAHDEVSVAGFALRCGRFQACAGSMVLTCAFLEQPDGGIQVLDIQVLAQGKNLFHLHRNIVLHAVSCKGFLQMVLWTGLKILPSRA